MAAAGGTCYGSYLETPQATGRFLGRLRSTPFSPNEFQSATYLAEPYWLTEWLAKLDWPDGERTNGRLLRLAHLPVNWAVLAGVSVIASGRGVELRDRRGG